MLTKELLFDAIGEIEDSFILDVSEILEHGAKHAYHHRRKVWTSLLIAAILALLLAACGYAIYRYTMRDRTISVESNIFPEGYQEQFSPVGYTDGNLRAEEHIIEGKQDGASPVKAGSSEYQALRELLEYEWNDHQEDMDIKLDPRDPIKRFYGFGWEGMARHLQSIAEKYGLRLYQSGAVTGNLDGFFAILGTEPFLPLSEAYEGLCTGSLYDDGSFELSAVKTPVEINGDTVEIHVTICRAVKGSFCTFFLIGDKPEEYLYENYETRSGQQVDLALGPRYSFIFAEREDCWITIGVDGGTMGTEYLPVIDLELLQFLADSVDFSRLSVQADEAYRTRVAEAQAKEDSEIKDASAGEEALRAKADVQTNELLQTLGFYELDTTLLPRGLSSGITGRRYEGKILDWCGDDRYVGLNTICFAYANVTQEDEFMLDLEYRRYDINGFSINEDAFLLYCKGVQEQEVYAFSDQYTVSGNKAFIACYQNYTSVVWYDPDVDLIFEMRAYCDARQMSDEQLIAIAESVSAR